MLVSAAGGVACATCMLLACSLSVSTSGLSGGDVPAQQGEGGDVSVPAAEGGIDAAGDGGPDAARDPSLVSELLFEDPPGSLMARDTSGFERHGFLQSNATFAADGVRGHALAVTGTGFVVVEGLAGPLFPRTGTLSLWFRCAKTAVEDVQRSVFDSYATDRAHIFMRHANGAPQNEFQMAMQPRASQYVAVRGVIVLPDTWTHLVMTWDEANGQAAFYANGVLLERSPYDAPFAPTDQLFRIGEGLVGGIDELRLYDRVLSDAEATKLD